MFWLDKKKLDEDTILDFLEYMSIKRKRSPATMRMYIVTLKMFCREVKVDFPTVKSPHISLGKPKYLEKEDFAKLYTEGAGDPLDKALLSVAYATGMRIGEVMTRKVKDLRIDDVRTAAVFVHGKTGEDTDAWLPLTKTAVLDIRTFFKWIGATGNDSMKPENYVFPSPLNRNNHMSVSGAETRLVQMFIRAGIEKPKGQAWHIVRHSRATHLREDGVNIWDIKDLLRHTSIATTLRYAHTDTEKLRKAISKDTETEV